MAVFRSRPFLPTDCHTKRSTTLLQSRRQTSLFSISRGEDGWNVRCWARPRSASFGLQQYRFCPCLCRRLTSRIGRLRRKGGTYDQHQENSLSGGFLSGFGYGCKLCGGSGVELRCEDSSFACCYAGRSTCV